MPESKPSVRAQTFLAFDLGQKRTGVAYGSLLLSQAKPLGVIAASGQARLAQMKGFIQEWQPQALVVGVPYHPDGAAHEQTQFAKNMAKQMRTEFRLEVIEIDERYSTTEAMTLQDKPQGFGKGAHAIDALSACVILNQYFEAQQREHHPSKPT